MILSRIMHTGTSFIKIFALLCFDSHVFAENVQTACQTFGKGFHCVVSVSTVEQKICYKDRDVYKEYINMSHITDSTHNLSILVKECVQCYVPHQCLIENECLTGSGGPTCERCLLKSNNATGYFRLGSSCVECTIFPWAVLVFIFFMIMVITMIVYVGFNNSVCTKLKQLVNFLQMILLTMSIKKQWSDIYTFWIGLITFGNCNGRFFRTECLDQKTILNSHYIEWITVLIFPLITVILYIIDFRMEKKLVRIYMNEETNEEKTKFIWKWRNYLRRASFFFSSCSFLPVLTSTLHSHTCARLLPTTFSFGQQDLFLLDQEIRCYEPVFQVLSGVLDVTAIMIILGVCVLGFYSFVIFRWNLFKQHFLLYGSLVESYKRHFCFWEVVIFLRKLVCLCLLELYLIPTSTQSLSALILSAVYTLACIAGRPFQKFYWRDEVIGRNRNLKVTDFQNVFEVIANLALIIFQTEVFLDVQGRKSNPLEIVATCSLVGSIILWIVLFLSTPLEAKPNQVVDWIVPSIYSRRKHSFYERKIETSSSSGMQDNESSEDESNM